MSEEDRAQEVELRQWERNNASRPAPVKYAPGEDGYGPEECDECGAKMPTARRVYGFELCVECKTIEEQRSRR